MALRLTKTCIPVNNNRGGCRLPIAKRTRWPYYCKYNQCIARIYENEFAKSEPLPRPPIPPLLCATDGGLRGTRPALKLGEDRYFRRRCSVGASLPFVDQELAADFGSPSLTVATWRNRESAPTSVRAGTSGGTRRIATVEVRCGPMGVHAGDRVSSR